MKKGAKNNIPVASFVALWSKDAPKERSTPEACPKESDERGLTKA